VQKSLSANINNTDVSEIYKLENAVQKSLPANINVTSQVHMREGSTNKSQQFNV